MSDSYSITLTKAEEKLLKDRLLNFVVRVMSTDKREAAELAILPDMTKLLLTFFTEH